jgi:Mn-dependent DtxR family transcriptional regulator
MRAAEIADYLGKRSASVRQTLSRMLRDGQVSLLDRGLYGVRA